MVIRVTIKRDMLKPTSAVHTGAEHMGLRAGHLTQRSVLLSKEERCFLKGCLLPESPPTSYKLLTTFHGSSTAWEVEEFSQWMEELAF